MEGERKQRRYLVAAVVVAAVSLTTLTAEPWSGFHGLERQGVAPDSSPPFAWAAASNVMWKVAVPGRGMSSPIVAGERVYLTTAYETTRGAVLRPVLRYGSATLALAGLALAALVAIGVASRGASGLDRVREGGRVVALLGLMMLVFVIAAWGETLFDLAQSANRSWKVGIVAGALGVWSVPLVSGFRALPRWGFVVMASLLGIGAYLSLQRRELFLDFSDRDGIRITALIMLPALAAWAVAAAWSLVRFSSQPAGTGHAPSASFTALATRLACLGGFPALAVSLLVWGVRRRALSHGAEVSSLAPAVGWVFAGAALATVLAIIAVGVYGAAKRGWRLESLRTPTATAAVMAAASCFVMFAWLPGQKELAYAVVCVDAKTGTERWTRDVARRSGVQDLKMRENSPATPTPVANADGVGVYFGTAGLSWLASTTRSSASVGE